MSQPIRDMADCEAEMVLWLFEDPQAFIKNIITTYMDEPVTRQLLGNFVKQVNKSLPFSLMNDLRLANATQSLQRMQIVKDLIANKMIMQ